MSGKAGQGRCPEASPFGEFEFGKESPRPVGMVPIRAAGDDERPRSAVFADVGGKAFVLIGIRFGPEITAATPGFVADAPIPDAEWDGRPVARPALRQRAVPGEIAVFDPVADLPRASTADIGPDIGFGAQGPADLNELMGSECIGFDVLPPPEVNPPGPGRPGADAVFPVVVVGEAPTRPAEHGGMELT